ncbi:hypothetical protein DFI02_1316 [Rhizobium sp. PP-F2F-G20b]|nr:hypothetical protein DFI02_1316 [Rhizobium sp. PP-F2F-G20b]
MITLSGIKSMYGASSRSNPLIESHIRTNPLMIVITSFSRSALTVLIMSISCIADP